MFSKLCNAIEIDFKRLCPNLIFFKIFFLNFQFVLEMFPEAQKYFNFFIQCIVLEIVTAVDIDRFVNTGFLMAKIDRSGTKQSL